MKSVQVVSVQVGPSQPSSVAAMGATAIVKVPVGSAMITSQGVAGDTIVDTNNHGGVDQAVYIYTADDYAWWAAQLGRVCEPGYFGENLTLSPGLASSDARIGDRYQIGEVLLEVTAPRIPCNIFADRVGRPQFVKEFRDANRPGIYCRVLTPGTVSADDSLAVTSAPADNLGIVECYQLHYDRTATAAQFEAALQSPVSERTKEELERRLARATANAESR